MKRSLIFYFFPVSIIFAACGTAVERESANSGAETTAIGEGYRTFDHSSLANQCRVLFKNNSPYASSWDVELKQRNVYCYATRLIGSTQTRSNVGQLSFNAFCNQVTNGQIDRVEASADGKTLYCIRD